MEQEQQERWDDAKEMEREYTNNPYVMLCVIMIRQNILFNTPIDYSLVNNPLPDRGEFSEKKLVL